jgi:Na+-translocating ferredoxin:NAD+ oxidoreductase RnfC subunit
MSIQVDLVPLLAYPHARLETIVMRHHSNARDAIESPLLSKAVYQAIIPLRQSFSSLRTLLLVHRSGSPEALTAHAQARYDRLQADLRGAGLRLCIGISME